MRRFLVCFGVWLLLTETMWAIDDYSQYHGPATIVYRDDTIPCKIIAMDSQVVHVVSSKINAGTESSLKAQEVVEIRFTNDKLVYDRNTKTYISASAAQSKLSGRVKITNHSTQPVQIVVTGRADGFGDDEEIDQLRDPKAAAWQMMVLPQESKYLDPEGKPVITSLLEFDVVTGDGKVHETRECSPSSSSSGEFEIPIENLDLHKPKIVELVKPWQFNQGSWTIGRLESTYAGSDTINQTSNDKSIKSTTSNPRTTIHPPITQTHPQATRGEVAKSTTPTKPNVVVAERARSSIQAQSNAKIGANVAVGHSTGLGSIIGMLRNPESKKLSVTATVTIIYHDATDPKKLVTRSFIDTLQFGPNEAKEWIISVPGTDSHTEGTVTDFDLSTQIVSAD